MSLRVVSYGGGVQSTALLVLAAQGRIDFPVFLMANVGDDSEHPATIAYVRDVAAPFAHSHGIALHVVDKVMRDGSTRTLYQQVMAENTPSIPVRIGVTAAPAQRSCTKHYKVKVIERWLKKHGASETSPAVVAMGISVDEIERANASRYAQPWQQITYPLLDLRLRRIDCETVIAKAGLPIPQKSACWFCPFTKETGWKDMARNEPDLFEKSARMEDSINVRRAARGKAPVYLTRFGRPLREVVNGDQLTLLDQDADCDSGWCMT